MPRVLVFQHVAAAPLGTLDPLMRRLGHRIRYVNFERDPHASPSVDRYHGLVVLGGAMNVPDKTRRAHLLTEMRAIESALRQGKPVLGICLGAQLLAHVLGAPVRRMDSPEVGWHPLRLTAAGRHDPVLGGHPDGAPVFQWHGYRFDLPDGARHLAGTDACREQAFRWGDHAYGFQFHLETDRALIGRWLANPAYRAQLEAAGLGHDVPGIRAQTERHVEAMQARAHAVFGRFLDLLAPVASTSRPRQVRWPEAVAAA